MSIQIAGKATIRIDGEVIPTENGASLTPNSPTRKAERHGGNTYYSEEETVPMLEANVLLTKDVDVLYLSNIKGATVMYESDNGKQYVLRNAFTTEAVPFSGDGKAAIKMSGQAVEEL